VREDLHRMRISNRKDKAGDRETSYGKLGSTKSCSATDDTKISLNAFVTYTAIEF
jgi:hypothetical protein